ncbi:MULTISPECIES: hypothetical protein [unclassified Brevundimonas]|uniref:hypothetical protein n=1 Tax=unclassified Brevundimonas TaxID=2622653 RepID=UPI0025C578EB|nr:MULTISPECIES: hypothetical protein [unclassified Brevundimonas]
MTGASESHHIVLSAEAIAYVQSRKAEAWRRDPADACRLVVKDRLIDLLALPNGAIWKAVPSIGKSIPICLERQDADYLDSFSVALGQNVSVLLQNLVEGGPFDPTPANKTGYLRNEHKRGRIYGFYMEVPGYQYSFLRTIGDTSLTGRDVLDEAIVALAEKLILNGEIRGVHPPVTTMQFAERLIKFNGLMAAPYANRPVNKAAISTAKRPSRTKKVGGTKAVSTS